MRLFRILSLYFHYAWSSKAENLVYFLMAFINPITAMLFWSGAFKDSQLSQLGWTLPEIITYYILLATAGSMLMAHIEYEVAYQDIYQGYLSQYLTRPYSYFSLNLLSEIPWRLIQGCFGLLFLYIFSLFFRGNVIVVHDPFGIIGCISIAVLAFLLSFIFKMMVGLTALWTTDFSGMENLVEVTILVLAGFVLPLSLFPQNILYIMVHQPFAYIIYFPVLAMIGKLSSVQIVETIFFQCCWIAVFYLMYRLMWIRGIKKFTGVGN